MGARGIGRPGSAKGAPPANILNIGVVARPVSAAPAAAPTNTAKAPEDADAVATVSNAAEKAAAPATTKKRATVAKKGARKKGTGTTSAGAPVAKRAGRKKTAAKTPAGSTAD
jgi:hypothetical protein